MTPDVTYTCHLPIISQWGHGKTETAKTAARPEGRRDSEQEKLPGHGTILNGKPIGFSRLRGGNWEIGQDSLSHVSHIHHYT